ncbi:MAG: DUF3379 family protein [Bradyrhizobium sp.]|uniref:DUF3379 family protein n=1 Tax=Bradyrhizobium sp. TaxID=376 RepID=UPI003D0E3398
MSCLQYRRALLAGTGETQAMRVHRLQCASCTQSMREHREMEVDLRRAFEVPIPAGFEDQLLQAVRRLEGLPVPVMSSRRRFLAAASVAAAVAGAGLLLWRDREDPVALACIQFVMRDEAKSLMLGAMPRAEAARVLADTLPLERIERIGRIQHIAPCPFNGGTAHHIILAVPQGKVTLLVMPVPAAGGVSAREGLHARVVALRVGSVGIVAGDADVVNSVAGALRG